MMDYKYPPIYKYAVFFIAIYMFLKHQQLMTPDKLLVNSIVMTLIMILIDFVIINNHPNLLENKNNNKQEDFCDDLSGKEIEEIINSYDMSIASDLESDDDDDQNEDAREYTNKHEAFNPVNRYNKTYNRTRQYFNTNDM